MTNPISFQSLPQPWMTEGAARRVYDALEKAGGAPRFVGGCVRDALLGRRINDVDIATHLTPDLVVKTLEAAGLKAVPTGIEHGTVTAVAEGVGIEVTTLRRDIETFGRHAVVGFTTDWREDAARRDLTMNAMSAEADGTVHDYFGGLDDLKAGCVRFVGSPADRMREDYLRILRFFRFHADYAPGDFDGEALAAAQALKENLSSLSGERLRQETLKLLAARRGVETWGEMLNLGIAEIYLPQATSLDRLKKVAGLESEFGLRPDPVRRLAALALTGSAGAIAEQLKLSSAERERIAAATDPRPDFAVADAHDVRRQIYDLGNARALDLLLIDWGQSEAVADWHRALEIVRDWKRPGFPLAGRDAVALGVAQGPRVGEVLKSVEAWWIAGDFAADRAACLAELRRRALN